MKSKRNLGWLAAADYYDEFNTPIGLLIILTSAKGLHAIVWDSDRQDARYNTLLEQLKKVKLKKLSYLPSSNYKNILWGKDINLSCPWSLMVLTFKLRHGENY